MSQAGVNSNTPQDEALTDEQLTDVAGGLSGQSKEEFEAGLGNKLSGQSKEEFEAGLGNKLSGQSKEEFEAGLGNR